MLRSILLVIAAVLGLLVLADGMRHVAARRVERQQAQASARQKPALVATASVAPAPPPFARPQVIVASSVTPDSATPAIDMMLRLTVRRRIVREGGRVYLDSLYQHTDSLLARWTDRSALNVTIAVDTGVAGWVPARAAEVRAAMHGWENNAAGITFRETPAGDSADIVVHWVDFLPERGQVGTTTLVWDSHGVAQRANVLLALRRNIDSSVVPPAQRTRVAMHELGHALGLPHSGSMDDVMFPAALSDAPSDRDQATLRLLYAVPPGPLRVQP